MKHRRLQRAVLFIITGVMAFTLMGCPKPQDKQPSTQTQTQDGKVFSEPTEISIAMSSDPTWPNNNQWKLWQYMREATGATFKVQAIPTIEFFTKVSLMMASPEELPDLLHITQKAMVDQYASSGALIAYDDNLDKMPNYQKFINSLPKQESEELINMRKCADGKIYNAPAYGTQTVNNARSWIYRKDIFEKHGIKPPETYDELYQVCKKLKKLYPNSYPFCIRDGLSRIYMMGPQWKPYLSYEPYYDFENKKWYHGALDPEIKEIVIWLRKMREEGLVAPDVVNMDSKIWEELMSTDRGFITLDYIVRIDYFNQLMQKTNPNYNLGVLKPPKKSATEGYHKMCKINLDLSGYAVCNTGNKKRMENAFRLVDWMYTDEACELLGWGKEGETYEVKDGRRQFIIPKKGQTPRELYGIASFGLFQRLPVDAYESTYSKEQIDACREATEYLEDYVNPMWWIAFTDEEKQEVDAISSEINNYTQEMLSKFILGQEPMSKWDSFTNEIKKSNVDKLLEVYSKAYARQVK